MPKRVIDFDALWASDKLAACAEWAQAEYAWLYGLADASGSFEMTNLRVIWGRVAAIRKNLTIERLGQVFDEFASRGLLFVWEENGKRYGHWTGSDVPGRLPPPSWRARLERLAPPVPREALGRYVARYGARRAMLAPGNRHVSAENPAPAEGEAERRHGGCRVESSEAESNPSPHPACGLNGYFEAPQGQDWDRDLERGKGKTLACPVLPGFDDPTEGGASVGTEASPERLLEAYEAERGPLPPAGRLTAERRRRSRRRIAAGLSAEDLRAAARRAAATPFLAGAGERGWRASFDWFIANDENARKVLAGRYDPPGGALSRAADPDAARAASAFALRGDRARSELRAGAGPVAAACGVRVKAAALERIRARQAGQPPGDTPSGQSERELPQQATQNVRERAS